MADIEVAGTFTRKPLVKGSIISELEVTEHANPQNKGRKLRVVVFKNVPDAWKYFETADAGDYVKVRGSMQRNEHNGKVYNNLVVNTLLLPNNAHQEDEFIFDDDDSQDEWQPGQKLPDDIFGVHETESCWRKGYPKPGRPMPRPLTKEFDAMFVTHDTGAHTKDCS